MFRRGIHDVAKRETSGKLFTRQGPGGRSSNAGITATVFGGTGFVGRYLINSLGKQGTQVVTPYRGIDDDKRHLRLMGDLGQIVQLRFDLRDEASIAECVRHSDVVYNLIGRNFSFKAVNVDGPRRLAKIAKENGVSKFIHISALNASPDSPSEFLKTKYLGEIAVREEFPDATIVRPSRIFGHEDWFFRKIGFFAKHIPFSVVPIIDGGKAKMRPVYVGDVAAALNIMLKDDSSNGKTVEFYGPREYYYKSLVEMFLEVASRQNRIVSFPKLVAKPIAAAWNAPLAFPIITPDEVERLTISDSPSKPGTCPTLSDFGIKPYAVEELIVRFVGMYRPHEFAHAPYNPVVKKYAIKQ